MRGIRYHRPIFAAVLVCIILLLTTFIKLPRDTLTEKSAALADGLLLCENGTLWEPRLESDEYPLYTHRGRDTTLGELRQRSEVIVAENIGEMFDAKEIQNEADVYRSEEMNAAEYAQANSIYGNVFADNSGTVWVPHREARRSRNNLNNEVILEPFFVEEKSYDAKAEHSIELPNGEMHFKVTGFSEENIPENATYTFSVLLEDGWHTLPESKCEVRIFTETVKTGTYEYEFENGNTTTLPLLERISEAYLIGSLSLLSDVGGTYRINVYEEREGQTVMLAERELKTKIMGSTLYID